MFGWLGGTASRSPTVSETGTLVAVRADGLPDVPISRPTAFLPFFGIRDFGGDDSPRRFCGNAAWAALSSASVNAVRASARRSFARRSRVFARRAASLASLRLRFVTRDSCFADSTVACAAARRARASCNSTGISCAADQEFGSFIAARLCNWISSIVNLSATSEGSSNHRLTARVLNRRIYQPIAVFRARPRAPADLTFGRCFDREGSG